MEDPEVPGSDLCIWKIDNEQWRFYVGAGGAIVSQVSDQHPIVAWDDFFLTMMNCDCLWRLAGRDVSSD